MLPMFRLKKPEPIIPYNQNTGPSNNGQQGAKCSTSSVATEANPIEITTQDRIHSVAFLADGEHVVSGGSEKKIRQWRVEDGREVWRPKDAGAVVYNLAVSQDGRWVACGTSAGQVTVWDAKSHKMVNEFKTHDWAVNALDISADGTSIAIGSDDWKLSVWSLPTGERLLGPLQHDRFLAAVKFSPDALFIATATWRRDSVRVYDNGDGSLVADFPIQVGSRYNGSLAWARDSNRLFVLSEDGNVHCLDVSTKKTLAKWLIHSCDKPGCIAVACDDTIVVTSANSSLSFWDTETHRQVGNVISHSYDIKSISISPIYDIVTAGDNAITLRNLCTILPSPRCDDLRLEREIQRLKVEKPDIYDMIITLRDRDAHQKDDVARLEKTVQDLRSQLAISNDERASLNETTMSLRKQNDTSNREMVHLDESGEELRSLLAASQSSVHRLTESIRTLRADVGISEQSPVFVAPKINELELSVQELDNQFAACKFALRVYDKKHKCENLYADGHIRDAAKHFANMMTEDLRHDKLVDWLKEFRHRCVSKLQEIGNEASSSKQDDEVLSAYSAILLLTPSPPKGVLMRWARMTLVRCSISETLDATDKFVLAKFYVYQAVCDVLREEDRLMEAVECFQRMPKELPDEINILDKRRQWELGFGQYCIEKMKMRGDTELNLKNHRAAIESYSTALSLHPINISDLVVGCCKARITFLEDELVDATQTTERDSSDYNGNRRKHAILHSLGRYKEAFDAFEMMLSSMENSLDPQILNMRGCYLDATPLIRKVVEQTVRDIPHVLINTSTGRLCDKRAITTAFEECPMFNKLRSSMITRDRLDVACIRREVKKFYEYAMFSHRWQPPEPSFQTLEDTPVYELPSSPANDKLINFCKLVRSRNFRWAWSDTCCINQSDNRVHQESIIAMFQWYYRAALTIIHLLGVRSESQEPGSLWGSIWNTRGWTYQEYIASKAVQFYTEDWKPYLGLKIFNHKESLVILAEMEQATMFATEALATLQPGLTSVREKLYLASKRQTTLEEDIAYCLFGVFDVALPVIYGEGARAIRRLLEHILTQSDNVTLLSWTQTRNSNSSTNSYLPSDLTVYDQIEPPHVPQPIEAAEMERMVIALRSSLPDPSLAIQLYERLHDIPLLSIITARLRLPGFVFPLTSITAEPRSDSIIRVYHATAPILGDVCIETSDDLVGMYGLALIHPWISPLMDRDFSGGAPRFDLVVRALRLVVRLKQPFGALLLASQGRVLYKRVATDSFIRVQIPAEASLKELMDSVRTVDVQ